MAPEINSHANPADVRIVVDRPNADIEPTSVNSASFVVHRSWTGQETEFGGRLHVSNDQIALDAPEAYHAGEMLQIIATQRITDATGNPLFPPYVWQIRVGASPSSGTLVVRPHPGLGDARAAGDLDRDGDLDLIMNGFAWLNNGAARFTDSGHSLPDDVDTVLGDVDGDGDLDAILSGAIWLNDGSGSYSESDQRIASSSRGNFLGDLDGDGDLDALGIAPLQGSVFINDGNGAFGDPVQQLPGDDVRAAALGDLDADGDLDILIAAADGNQTWFNNGSGSFEFVDSTFGFDERPEDVRLGDLDGDGLLDAVVVGQYWNYVLMNFGDGFFYEYQDLGAEATGVEIADLNGDGALDVLLSGLDQESILLNDEFGFLASSGQRLPDSNGRPITGDFDGDGDIDLVQGTMLWLNDGAGVGDADGDGNVSFADFLIFVANFGRSDASFAEGDFDGDGKVAFTDFLLLTENFTEAENLIGIEDLESRAFVRLPFHLSS